MIVLNWSQINWVLICFGALTSPQFFFRLYLTVIYADRPPVKEKKIQLIQAKVKLLFAFSLKSWCVKHVVF